MNDIIFRLAQVGDAKEIYDIYAPYVENTAFTFEYEAPGIPALMDRIINTMNTYPYIVCLIDGHVAAYTYASRHMVRAAYQWNAELSVYVDGRFRGMGIGTALYTAIIEVLKLQNVQNIFACISRDNTSSRLCSTPRTWDLRSLGYIVMRDTSSENGTISCGWRGV